MEGQLVMSLCHPTSFFIIKEVMVKKSKLQTLNLDLGDTRT